jgi:hypothetical protein
MIRHLCAVALLMFAAGCGHKTETQSTSTTTTVATNAPAPSAVSSTAPMSAPAGGATKRGSTGAGQPPGFDTETAAQAHCGADTVVWLNTKSRVYHLKGAEYYGHTKKGAYVCKKEADAAGDREAKTGAVKQ